MLVNNYALSRTINLDNRSTLDVVLSAVSRIGKLERIRDMVGQIEVKNIN